MKEILLGAVMAALTAIIPGTAPADASELRIWPGAAPGETGSLGDERDTTQPTDNLIAGARVMRIGNVSSPTIAIFRPPRDKDTGASVIICPGGGHHILAYDLEGTEVAAWLNTLGVTGIVLKYRVPAREGQPRWKAAVQDAQRAVSLVRTRAGEWGLDPNRIGILGFSAGGETAALTALFGEEERQYEPVDATDRASSRPNFAVLVYTGGLVVRNEKRLHDHVRVTAGAPPMFLVHAHDDNVPVDNSLLLYRALKEAGIPGELHVYSFGGHGYGLRRTEVPVTTWPDRCEAWLRHLGVLERPEEREAASEPTNPSEAVDK
jgi:acetyl esterase/lipase